MVSEKKYEERVEEEREEKCARGETELGELGGEGVVCCCRIVDCGLEVLHVCWNPLGECG